MCTIHTFFIILLFFVVVVIFCTFPSSVMVWLFFFNVRCEFGCMCVCVYSDYAVFMVHILFCFNHKKVPNEIRNENSFNEHFLFSWSFSISYFQVVFSSSFHSFYHTLFQLVHFEIMASKRMNVFFFHSLFFILFKMRIDKNEVENFVIAKGWWQSVSKLGYLHSFLGCYIYMNVKIYTYAIISLWVYTY